jgi:Cu+-exporting ATPase
MDTVKTIHLPIKGMSCSSCSRAVERQVENLDGLISQKIDFVIDSGEFTYDVNKLSYHTLIEKINEGHYKVDLEGYDFNSSKKEIPVCKTCGIVGQLVPNTVFRSLLLAEAFNRLDFEDEFQICMNPVCPTAYYSSEKKQVVDQSELKRELWYKEGVKRKIICYCNNIDTTQIDVANNEFDLHEWDEVMGHYRKKVIERCEVLNPTGLCCKDTYYDYSKNKRVS